VSVLDNPIWHALAGPQATVAERKGEAVRYDPAYAPFAAVPDDPTPDDWEALAALLGPDGVAVVSREPFVLGDDWEPVFELCGTQMVWDGRAVALPDVPVVPLTTADVPEVLDLVGRTKPGPFAARTIELGTYLGIRVDGALVAMAGERMHPPGHREISAVCTDPAFRGRGLAGALTLHLAAGVLADGEIPCLHADASNTNAIRLYEQLGFSTARSFTFAAVRRRV
jgi:ribosomal protein S18 acetylase RimI-like enzyme